MEKKFFTVQEAADLLGISEISIRRRIQAGLIKAVIHSKKQGYRIPKDSLIAYAKNQNSKIGSFFSRGLSHFVPAFVATRSFPAGVTAGVLGAIFSSLFEDDHEPDEKTATALNNPLIVQKLIELLNVELTDFDLKIEFQEFKLSQITNDSDLYALEMETLFKLKYQKSDILKKIKELEIHKACLESV